MWHTMAYIVSTQYYVIQYLMVKKMIKRIRGVSPSAPINSEDFRKTAESFESEMVRGIGTLAILKIIKLYGAEGTYGYQILKELEERTKDRLVIEEGTLYPMLKKLENWGPAGHKIPLVTSDRREFNGRLRKYYRLTSEGLQIVNYMEGFFAKLTESLSGIISMDVALDTQKFLFCPNCANKIELDSDDDEPNFCNICGMSLQDFFKHEVN